MAADERGDKPRRKAPASKTEGPALRYFDEVLMIERAAINLRRNSRSERDAIRFLQPSERKEKRERADIWRPEPRTGSFERPIPGDRAPSGADPSIEPADFKSRGRRPDRKRQRPTPEPNDCTGLALSGGGIRSASFCLGAIQALESHSLFPKIDYLSTVSGGGYIGSAMTAATSRSGQFPFVSDDDLRDTGSIAHLRNYSNYLLPRGRSAARNILEAAAIIIRGLVANAVVVIGLILMAALATSLAFPNVDTFTKGSFIPRLIDAAAAYFARRPDANELIGAEPFRLSLWLATVGAGLLLLWVLLRSSIVRSNLDNGRVGSPERSITGAFIFYIIFSIIIYFAREELITYPMIKTTALITYILSLFIIMYLSIAIFVGGVQANIVGDSDSLALLMSRLLLLGLAVVAVFDAVPFLLLALDHGYELAEHFVVQPNYVLSALAVPATGIAVWSDRLGRFLKMTERQRGKGLLARRLIARAALYLAAALAPLLILLLFLHMAAWAIAGLNHVPWMFSYGGRYLRWWYFFYGAAAVIISLFYSRNAYSLHRFYRDRLSKAFLFNPDNETTQDGDLQPLDSLRLSEIDTLGGPYHILNAALNVQGSAEANRRGRNADFFTFTRDAVGSDLTMFTLNKEQDGAFAKTMDMEAIDPQLNLGTAMAISGAAISANMGTSTVRGLSPTLALLNVRLGYWLRNPRSLAERTGFLPLEWIFSRLLGKFYLFLEMFNLLDETSRHIYLTDGGHIENLGIYELLKRGCGLIIAIDAEADPSLAFPSLIRLERYARIDLGVRIELPWKEIRKAASQVKTALNNGEEIDAAGPHIAVGRITYSNNVHGILVYVKSCLTGDERDYVLDYARRNPEFPHETTSDQFFSEEQFEAYRALGFHSIEGFLSGADQFALSPDIFKDAKDAINEVKHRLR